MAAAGVRHIRALNQQIASAQKLPYLVVCIHDLADLMLASHTAFLLLLPDLMPTDPDPVDIEAVITPITQRSRAAGIHLIATMQPPRAEALTKSIQDSLPARIAFRLGSTLLSRMILDENGAETLVGEQAMIYKAHPSSPSFRARGATIATDEMGAVVDLGQTHPSGPSNPEMSALLLQSLAGHELPPVEDGSNALLETAKRVRFRNGY